MNERPKFNPISDDYWAVVIEDGSWLEYASTDQFEELFNWADEAEKEINKLKEFIAKNFVKEIKQALKK